MKKLHLTLLALLALTLTGCEDNHDKNRIRFVNSYDIYTDTIRGHIYMHVYEGGIIHAPDCPCREKGGENE